MVLVKCLKCAVWEFHWPSQPPISLSSSAVALLPWKTEPFSPHCTHSFSGHREDGTDLFTHECFCERREASAFQFLPLDSNLGQGRESSSVSFYCFYLSCYLRFLFYLTSFKSNQKFFHTIIHHYFLKKQIIKKNSQNEENVPEIASDCIGFLAYT